MTPKGHFEINWPLAKVLDCIKSAEYFLEFATNRSAMLPQILWKCGFIKARQIIFYKKSPLLNFKVKIVKWQNSWIRNKKVMQSAVTKFPIPNINFSRSLVFNQSNFFDERNHGKKIGWLTNYWKFGIQGWEFVKPCGEQLISYISRSAHANNQFYETRIFVYLLFE